MWTDYRKEGSLYAVHKYLNPMVTGTVDNKRVAAAEKALRACLDDFEKMWLRDGRKYVAGEEISVGDILAVCELEQPIVAGLRVEEGKPPMAEYMDRVRGLLFSGTVTGFTNDFQNMP